MESVTNKNGTDEVQVENGTLTSPSKATKTAKTSTSPLKDHNQELEGENGVENHTENGDATGAKRKLEDNDDVVESPKKIRSDNTTNGHSTEEIPVAAEDKANEATEEAAAVINSVVPPPTESAPETTNELVAEVASTTAEETDATPAADQP